MLEINITSQNFEREVLKCDGTILVDFWATWCAPCQMLSPVLTEIAEQYKSKIKIGKINVDEQKDLVSTYKISSIPTLLLFEKGKIINTFIGFYSKKELEEKLDLN